MYMQAKFIAETRSEMSTKCNTYGVFSMLLSLDFGFVIYNRKEILITLLQKIRFHLRQQQIYQ